MLRENWMNIWWLPDGSTVTPLQISAVNAPINYPPNQVIDNKYTVKVTGDTRIVSIFGHRHAWTTRFSALLTRADGTTQDLYESFSWLEMLTYQLDSVTTNPGPHVDGTDDGAVSGVTMLHAGDQVSFTCHADTTTAGAAKLGVPVPNGNLTFGNEAFGAEMCVLYLETTGAAMNGFGHVPSMGQ
jgi:hypothetical protein